MSHRIESLVKKYKDNRDHYQSKKYNESQLRIDFLDPFFEILGWDIKNESGRSTHEREVIVEESLKGDVSENVKKPDYSFRLYSDRKFFLEAKKPSVSIDTDGMSARQVRRYGYTAKLKISILSNFEYLAIYDCSIPVKKSDEVHKSRIQLIHCDEYVEKIDYLKKMIGRESVYSGEFDISWADIESNVGTVSVDQLFLTQLNQWRILLGNQIFSNEINIETAELNDLVQRYINSIVFLRVCEDRNLETYKTLLSCAENDDFGSLISRFKAADKKYNAGLFDLPKIEQVITDSGSSFWEIIRSLYFPESPYSFSVFSSDILGHIYEIFLGEELVVSGGQVLLMKKPEMIDRDVVTTPTYIVREILNKTVTNHCQNKTDQEILNSKFADISCGSGAFLTEAFQLLHDTLVDYYIENDREKLIATSVDSFKLPYEMKRMIVQDCLFGIDKDYNAVEACKFGLLLKLLEGEYDDTLTSPALPSLSNSIVFGNSLLDSSDVLSQDLTSINPYDFGDLEFDVIFGNPPYMATEHMKQFTENELPIYKRDYEVAFKQFDKYFLFIERGYKLLRENGILGYIVPSKLTKLGAAKNLRDFLIKQKALSEMISFGANQIFVDKTTYTCLLFLSKNPRDEFVYSEVKSLEEWKIRRGSLSSKVALSTLNKEGWALVPPELANQYNHILAKSITLEELVGDGNIFNGIQTSANKIYIHKPVNEDTDYIYFVLDGRSWKVEKVLTRPYFKTAPGIDALNTYRPLKPNSFVIYPYLNIDGRIELVDIEIMKSDYPYLYDFLLAHRDGLENDRRDIKPTPVTSNEWYRYGRHQSLDKCDVDLKIVVGVLSQGDKYAIDVNGTLISSGGTAGYCMITPPNDCLYSPYYVQALLNSKYCEWFASIYGEVFRGGFIARGTKVLKRLPIRAIDFSSESDVALHDDIVDLQSKLIAVQANIDASKDNQRQLIPLVRQFKSLSNNMNLVLTNLYDLGEDDESIPLISELYATH